MQFCLKGILFEMIPNISWQVVSIIELGNNAVPTKLFLKGMSFCLYHCVKVSIEKIEKKNPHFIFYIYVI